MCGWANVTTYTNIYIISKLLFRAEFCRLGSHIIFYENVCVAVLSDLDAIKYSFEDHIDTFGHIFVLNIMPSIVPHQSSR